MKTYLFTSLIMGAGLLILGGSAAALLSHLPYGSCGGSQCGSKAPPQEKKPAPSTSSGDYTAATQQASLVSEKDEKKVDIKKVPFGKNVTFEIAGEKRRVVIQSYVCLRAGTLEQLLTTRNGKPHESILAADLDAKAIHAALLACGAKAGHPVRFTGDKVEPPTGSVIKIFLEYKNKEGKLVRFPAQQWVRGIKSQKDLDLDWVFAGSVLIPVPDDPKAAPFYGANGGDVFCVANMETALLDLPVDFKSNSGRANGDTNFEAHTERIPELDTPVTIILEPVVEKKK